MARASVFQLRKATRPGAIVAKIFHCTDDLTTYNDSTDALEKGDALTGRDFLWVSRVWTFSQFD